MSVRFHASVLTLALLGASCGGSSPSGPTPPTPTPTPAPPGHDVTAVVFYDEDGNGVLGGFEKVRLPDVVVEVAGHNGRTAQGSGQAVVGGVPAGKANVSIRADSLPPYYLPPTPVSIDVPQAAGAVVALPVGLPIGVNKPNRHLAFGDSITVGDGSSSIVFVSKLIYLIKPPLLWVT